MDAFALNTTDDDPKEEGFAVLFDEEGIPVIRALNDIKPPETKTIYAMLWSLIGQIAVSHFPDEAKDEHHK